MSQSAPPREPGLLVPDALAAAAEQASKLAGTAFAIWADESRSFLDGMARDGAQALQELGACRTPLAAVVVEQKWLMARTTACIDASFRVMAEIFHEPEQAAAETSRFRLPD